MNGQQDADPRFQSPASCFGMQDFCSRSLISQRIRLQPQLLGMLEDLGSALRPLREPDESIQPRDTLQSLVQSCRCGSRGEDNSIQSPPGNVQECKHHQTHRSSINFGKNTGVGDQCFSKFRLEKKHQVRNGVSEGKDAVKQKTRIRWSEDLHRKFMECVDSLGGAKKATPKAILKLMKCNGLTIFHVKSHLQKYRDARLMPEATKGTADQLDSQTGLQIMEALRLQIDVQRRLFEQLESQKSLQKRIEEQAKQLQTMLQCHLNTK